MCAPSYTLKSAFLKGYYLRSMLTNFIGAENVQAYYLPLTISRVFDESHQDIAENLQKKATERFGEVPPSDLEILAILSEQSRIEFNNTAVVLMWLAFWKRTETVPEIRIKIILLLSQIGCTSVSLLNLLAWSILFGTVEELQKRIELDFSQRQKDWDQNGEKKKKELLDEAMQKLLKCLWTDRMYYPFPFCIFYPLGGRELPHLETKRSKRQKRVDPSLKCTWFGGQNCLCRLDDEKKVKDMEMNQMFIISILEDYAETLPRFLDSLKDFLQSDIFKRRREMCFNVTRECEQSSLYHSL
jgi:hypothetical protein